MALQVLIVDQGMEELFLYLEMNQDCVDDYQKDPTNVDYRLLIFGDKLTPKEAYEKAYHY